MDLVQYFILRADNKMKASEYQRAFALVFIYYGQDFEGTELLPLADLSRALSEIFRLHRNMIFQPDEITAYYSQVKDAVLASQVFPPGEMESPPQ